MVVDRSTFHIAFPDNVVVTSVESYNITSYDLAKRRHEYAIFDHTFHL